MSQREEDRVTQAVQRLREKWDAIHNAPEQVAAPIPNTIETAIQRSINSATKTYRYVLPTQLLAKLVDSSLDCHAVQESSALAGSFDARSFCNRTIVPFDREHHDVLGGSGDPYVNNPLRIPEISAEQGAAQRNREGFADLVAVLDFAEENPELVDDLFRLALLYVKDRLDRTNLVYPAPRRASLDDVLAMVGAFLQERTGGRRLQAISVALFRTIGDRFNLFARVESRHVNSADIRSGHAADLACHNTAGDLVVAVEVKDRKLAVREVQDKIRNAREQNIKELLFLMRGGVQDEDVATFEGLKQHQFRSGHNIYECEFNVFLRTALVMMGEEGRRLFLTSCGEAIDETCELTDRERWQQMLESM